MYKIDTNEFSWWKSILKVQDPYKLIILGSSKIEQILEDLLFSKIFLVKNKGFKKEIRNKVLFNFESRILVAYGSGLINHDVYRILMRFKKCRNEIAHSSDPELSIELLDNIKDSLDSIVKDVEFVQEIKNKINNENSIIQLKFKHKEYYVNIVVIIVRLLISITGEFS